MPAVHVVLMTLFAGYVLALFRLLHTYSGSRFHAGMLAILGGITLPAGAFVFQIYPEVAAGLV